MMRTLGGVLLGLLLFFPGVVLLKWLSVSVLGVYGALTVTDGCLVMIIILLSVILVRGNSPVRSRAAAPARRTSRTVEHYPGEPQLEFLPGEEPRRRRQPTGRRTRTPRRER